MAVVSLGWCLQVSERSGAGAAFSAAVLITVAVVTAVGCPGCRPNQSDNSAPPLSLEQSSNESRRPSASGGDSSINSEGETHGAEAKANGESPGEESSGSTEGSGPNSSTLSGFQPDPVKRFATPTAAAEYARERLRAAADARGTQRAIELALDGWRAASQYGGDPSCRAVAGELLDELKSLEDKSNANKGERDIRDLPLKIR